MFLLWFQPPAFYSSSDSSLFIIYFDIQSKHKASILFEENVYISIKFMQFLWKISVSLFFHWKLSFSLKTSRLINIASSTNIRLNSPQALSKEVVVAFGDVRSITAVQTVDILWLVVNHWCFVKMVVASNKSWASVQLTSK